MWPRTDKAELTLARVVLHGVSDDTVDAEASVVNKRGERIGEAEVVDAFL